MAPEMPEPCRFPSHSLWTHKEVHLTPHLVVGLVLQAGDTEKYPHSLGLKSLDSFFTAIEHGPCFTAAGEDGGDKRLVELELA